MKGTKLAMLLMSVSMTSLMLAAEGVAAAETATMSSMSRNRRVMTPPRRQQTTPHTEAGELADDTQSIGQAFHDMWDSVPKHAPIKNPKRRRSLSSNGVHETLLRPSSPTTSTLKLSRRQQQQQQHIVHQPLAQRFSDWVPMWAKKLAVDTFAAGTAAFAVSPFVTIVDRSIIASSSGTVSMGVCFREAAKELIFKSTTFLKRPEFLWTWGLYAATYFAANAMTTFCDSKGYNVAMPKFFSTTLVNLPAGIAKDLAIAKMFGLGTGGAVPLMSYTLFTMRDCGTMAASFSVPASMSQKMQSAGVEERSADVMSQLLTPGLGQFIFTPIHLLGLDIYTNRGATLASRLSRIGASYPAAVALRFGRIGAAFGIGGLGNTSIRNKLMTMIALKDEEGQEKRVKPQGETAARPALAAAVSSSASSRNEQMEGMTIAGLARA